MDEMLHGKGKPPGGSRVQPAKHALIIEADRGTQDLCRHVLESEGYKVDGSDSGVEGLKIALQTTPAVILLDLNLRDVLGVQFLEWLHSNPALKAVPVIGIGVLAGDASRLESGGVKTVLNKPLTVAGIKRALRAVFA